MSWKYDRENVLKNKGVETKILMRKMPDMDNFRVQAWKSEIGNPVREMFHDSIGAEPDQFEVFQILVAESVAEGVTLSLDGPMLCSANPEAQAAIDNVYQAELADKTKQNAERLVTENA